MTAHAHAIVHAAPSGRSIASIVVGALGLVGLGILSPLAWLLGVHELNAIRRGVAPMAGRTLAQVGMVFGIIGTVLMAPILLLLGVAGFAMFWFALLALACL